MTTNPENDFNYVATGDSILVTGKDGVESVVKIVSRDSILITCDEGGQYFASDGTSTLGDGSTISVPEFLDSANALTAARAAQESAENIKRIAERGASAEEVYRMLDKHAKNIVLRFDFLK